MSKQVLECVPTSFGSDFYTVSQQVLGPTSVSICTKKVEYRVFLQVLERLVCVYRVSQQVLDLFFTGCLNKFWDKIVFHFVLRMFTTGCSNKFWSI